MAHPFQPNGKFVVLSDLARGIRLATQATRFITGSPIHLNVSSNFQS